MDNQSDSAWIEPLETTALSADDEAKTQTSVSLEGDMNCTGSGVAFPFDIRRRGRGRTIKGGIGGCHYDSPLTTLLNSREMRNENQNETRKLEPINKTFIIFEI